MHLSPNNSDDNRSVALYSDFENLHAGLMEAKYGEGAYATAEDFAAALERAGLPTTAQRLREAAELI
jgi:hypothetical protein